MQKRPRSVARAPRVWVRRIGLARAAEAAAARGTASATTATWTAGARPTARPAGTAGASRHRLAGQQAFALCLFARQLARSADGLGLLAHALLGRLLVIVPQLHLAENALALHLLLQRLEG